MAGSRHGFQQTDSRTSKFSPSWGTRIIQDEDGVGVVDWATAYPSPKSEIGANHLLFAQYRRVYKAPGVTFLATPGHHPKATATYG